MMDYEDPIEPLAVDALSQSFAASFDEDLDELPELSEEEAAALKALKIEPGDKDARPRTRPRCRACEQPLSRAKMGLCAACLAPHHPECLREVGACVDCGEPELIRPGAASTAPRRRSWRLIPAVFLAGGLSAAALSSYFGASEEKVFEEKRAPLVLNAGPYREPSNPLMISDFRLLGQEGQLEAEDRAQYKLAFWNLSRSKKLRILDARIVFTLRRNHPGETAIPKAVRYSAKDYIRLAGPLANSKDETAPWFLGPNSALNLYGTVLTTNTPGESYPRRVLGEVEIRYQVIGEDRERRFWGDVEMQIAILPD